MAEVREAARLEVERTEDTHYAIVARGGETARLRTSGMRLTLYDADGNAFYYNLTRDGFTAMVVAATAAKCDA